MRDSVLARARPIDPRKVLGEDELAVALARLIGRGDGIGEAIGAIGLSQEVAGRILCRADFADLVRHEIPTMGDVRGMLEAAAPKAALTAIRMLDASDERERGKAARHILEAVGVGKEQSSTLELDEGRARMVRETLRMARGELRETVQ